MLSVVAAALLFPVLIFIGGATRLSAARREQRFAAMRLVGATPRQIADIATVESSVAAVDRRRPRLRPVLRPAPAIAHDPVHRRTVLHRRPVADAGDVLAVAVGIPVARRGRRPARAAPGHHLPARRHPPGDTAPRPRVWRLLPLLAGLGELGYLAYVSDIGQPARRPARPTPT